MIDKELSNNSNVEIINELDLPGYHFKIYVTKNDSFNFKIYNLKTNEDTQIGTFNYGLKGISMNEIMRKNWNKNKTSKYDYGDLQVENKPDRLKVYFHKCEPVIDIRDKKRISELNEFVETTLKHGRMFKEYKRNAKINEILK